MCARGSSFLELQVPLAETLAEKACAWQRAVAYFQDVFLKHDTPQSKNFSF